MATRQGRDEFGSTAQASEIDPDTVTANGAGEVLVEVFSTRFKPSASVLEPRRRLWAEPPGEGAGDAA